MDLVDLDVTLPDLPYEVRRKVTVPLDLRLTDLHLVLQAVMGWDNAHLYDFACGRKLRWADMDDYYEEHGDRRLKTSTLADILAEMGRHKVFVYTYDMGDSWEHVIQPAKPYAGSGDGPGFALTLAEGSCPPDDSGGVSGFCYMLDCLADPTSDEREDYVDWLGAESWDTRADVADLTARLAKLGKRLAKRYAATTG